jgi:hypothetical protein
VQLTAIESDHPTTQAPLSDPRQAPVPLVGADRDELAAILTRLGVP